MNIKNKTGILLFLIILLGFSLRVYKVDQIPPSLSWDEAAVGYNGFTIANWGKDEYGKTLPLYFRSFGEDKQPVHIYITALFVKALGLSEFSVRLPIVVFGVLNILLIFYLVKEIFKNEKVGLISSLFLSISPQNFFFSRFNHEANIALFFFMLGLLLFFKALNKKRSLLIFSLISFFVSMISYHAAEIIIPLTILFLVVFYLKELLKDKQSFFISFILIILLAIFSLLNPHLLGVNRYDQTIQGKDKIEETGIFQKTHNYILGRISLALIQYSWHFDPNYLFISGDDNGRLSSRSSGEFLKIDFIFLIAGVLFLVHKRSKEGILLLSLGLIAPIPSALFSEAPHVGRAAFMMGTWNIVSAFGLFYILSFLRNKLLKWVAVGIVGIMLIFLTSDYLKLYFNDFSKGYAVDWQYGMKQMVEYVKSNPNFEQVYITDVRAQPYIFFLFYLQEDLSKYLSSAVLNNTESSGYNNISYFDKYSFGGWEVLESMPSKGVLYIVSPSEYDGLRHKSEFDVKKVIYYPNGISAFYIVSAKI